MQHSEFAPGVLGGAASCFVSHGGIMVGSVSLGSVAVKFCTAIVKWVAQCWVGDLPGCHSCGFHGRV